MKQRETKTFYIENLGCAKNQVDADIMVHALESRGWRQVSKPEGDSAILVNTCAFIRDAKEESINSILDLRGQYPDATVIATGCLAQRYGGDLVNEMAELDGVFGNRAPGRIGAYLEEDLPEGRRLVVPEERGLDDGRTNRFAYPGSAYVKIAEGCDTNCAFCAIPLIRGRLASRRIADIVGEVEGLLRDGAQEVILVAQDLTTFGRDRRGAAEAPNGAGEPGEAAKANETDEAGNTVEAAATDAPARESLTELIRRLSALPGDFWVRLLYLYPERFPEELLQLCAADPRILPYFDIPFQHADRGVLRGMSRPGDAARFLELVRTIRREVPDAVIRSTFMVGYPGETNDAFEELHAFVRDAALDWAGFFVYSPEEDTPAYRSRKIGPRVSKSVARRRKDLLEDLQGAVTRERLDRFIGRTLSVLIEELVDGEDLAIGRCYAQAPEVDGLVVVRTDEASLATGLPGSGEQSTRGIAPGARVPVRIIRRNGIDLEGVPVR